MSKTYLKIKIKSLAAEAHMIRAEEKKFKAHARRSIRRDNTMAHEAQRSIFWGLRDHRNGIVRDEARAAQVAYGFIRGRAYRDVENPEKGNTPVMHRVVELVDKYGNEKGSTTLISNAIAKWMEVPRSPEAIAKEKAAKAAQLKAKKARSKDRQAA